jgi:hypothetical protein
MVLLVLFTGFGLNNQLRRVAFNIKSLTILFHDICSYAMPLLYTGRRRTKLDRKYNGPPRQGPVRHISPAQLNLERLYEQNRLNVQKKDAAKAPEPAPGPAAKGKPRLLLMGQRRRVEMCMILQRTDFR